MRMHLLKQGTMDNSENVMKQTAMLELHLNQ